MALDLLAKRCESDSCIISNTEVLTKRQLRALSREFDISKELSLAFLIASNCPESIAIYTELARHGVACCILDRSVQKKTLHQLIERFRPDVLYVPRDFNASTVAKVTENNHGNYRIIRLESIEKNINPDLGLLLPTSGSTGSPKMVKISYDNIKSNTESIIKYLRIDKESRHITSLPMSYTYGLSCINTHLYAGGIIICTEDSVITREFWDLVERHNATTMSGVPYTYELILRNSEEMLARSSIHTFTQAGGKLKEWCLERLIKMSNLRDKKIFVMYGQTEATARISYLPHDKLVSKPGSIGIPIPGGSIHLGKIYTEKRLPGKIKTGELIFKGPNVTMGYATTLEDLALGDIRGGILETGDIGYCDDEGYWYIVGRISDFAKIAGKRICLADIEKELSRMGYNSVVKSNDERISIFVEKEGGALTNEEDKKFAKRIKQRICKMSNLHPSQLEVNVMIYFPRLASGKIDSKAIKA